MRSFILVHWILVFLATSARTINKTRLKIHILKHVLAILTTYTEISYISFLEYFLARIGDLCRISFVDIKSFVSLADCDRLWK